MIVLVSDEIAKLRVLLKMFDADIEIVFSPYNPGSMFRLFRGDEMIWPLYESDFVTFDDLKAQVSRIIDNSQNEAK